MPCAPRKPRARILSLECLEDRTLPSTAAGIIPNNPAFAQQWNLLNTGQGGGTPGDDIQATQAWNVTTGSPNVTVAVLDTGIDLNNPGLVDNIWINQAEIPNEWLAGPSLNQVVYKSQIKLVNGDTQITFRDLNAPVNAGLINHSDGNALIDPGDLLRPISQGGWQSGSTQDGDTAHPDDFFGWNFVNNNNDPFDGNGHGTAVASTIGGVGNNGIGMAGVDWNTQIMALQFVNVGGSGTTSELVQAINYAVAHGAKIANVSWVTSTYSSQLQSAVASAQSAGVIVVAAAGNTGTDTDTAPLYPADFNLNNVISVAATDYNNSLAGFSSYGKQTVTLGAPGFDVTADSVGGGYTEFSGTSFAAPQVAGVLALVWSEHPSWSYTQVINQVLSTVEPLPSLQGKTITGGLLDAAAAVGATGGSVSLAVVSASLSGSASNTIDTAQVTFNEPVDPSSSVPVHAALLLPDGVTIHPTSITPVSGSNNTIFTLTFPVEAAPGTYQLTVGPWFVAAATEQPMAAADILSSTLSSSIVASPPLVFSEVSATMTGTAPNTIDTAQVTFNEPVDLSSAVPVHAALLLPDGATIHPTSITPVSGSNNTIFTLSFPVQSAPGTYQLTVGPWFVAAATEQPMAAAAITSATISSSTIASPPLALSVVNATLTGAAHNTIDTAQVTFNEPVDLSSAVPVHAALLLPNGATIHPTSVAPVAGSNNTVFTLTFPVQSAPGSYQLRIGPWFVAAATEQPMAATAISSSTIALVLSVVSETVTGAAPNTIDTAVITFNQPVDPASVVTAHASLLLPNGVTIHPTSITPVPGSNNTILQLTLPVQSQPGAYDLSISSWIVAAATGQPMAAPYDVALSITDES